MKDERPNIFKGFKELGEYYKKRKKYEAKRRNKIPNNNTNISNSDPGINIPG